MGKYLFMMGVCAVAVLILFLQMFHCNNVDKIQIIQNVNGSIEIRRDGGWYPRFFPRIWEYPKASVDICSEADRDAIVMQFSNKTTARLNCQIGYRIDSTNDETVIRLHQQVEGSDEKIWQKVRTSLQTVAQCVASQYTPSESVEKFPEFAKKIHDAIIHEAELLKDGIDVVSFTCAGLPKYDKETEAQFSKQKDADLAKRLAEAEKVKLEAEKLKVEANYQMQIAEQKGQAEAQMAKDVQSKEREKKMAEIEAAKAVEVAKLEKEKAVIEVERQKEVAKVEAEKLFVVAEVQKRTEAENLEAIKLQAEQKVATAEAKKKEIELSGAITEQERVKLEIEKETKIGVAKAYAEGIGKLKLPTVMASGNGSSGAESALNTFFQLKNAAIALELIGEDSVKSPEAAVTPAPEVTPAPKKATVQKRVK
jgi:regulator of protease activity HflC (stomatin/prohibitin superfamily)